MSTITLFSYARSLSIFLLSFRAAAAQAQAGSSAPPAKSQIRKDAADPDLKVLAKKITPTVREHLQMTKQGSNAGTTKSAK